jgi:hypothetical protein
MHSEQPKQTVETIKRHAKARGHLTPEEFHALANLPLSADDVKFFESLGMTLWWLQCPTKLCN